MPTPASKCKTVRFCERESDKLLSMPSDENTSKQKYGNNQGKETVPQGQSNPKAGAGSTGDHLSTADTRSTTSKTTDFQQLKIVEGEPSIKKTNWKRKVLKVVVTLMFIVMVVVVVVVWTLHDSGGEYMKEDGYFVFDINNFKLIVEVEKYETAFEVVLGGEGFKKESKDICQNSRHKFCYALRKGSLLLVNSETLENIQCYSVNWVNITEYIPQDCFDLQYGLWYGMLNTANPSGQLWPIQYFSLSSRIYAPGVNAGIGDVIDYYWVSTTGTAIYVKNTSPLEMSFNMSNNNRMCISPSKRKNAKEIKSLNYTVCQGKNIKEVHEGINKYVYQSTPSYNNSQIYLDSSVLWSVNSQDANSGSGTTVVEFQRNLASNNLNCSLMEIRDWENRRGDFTVSSSKVSTNFDSVFQSLEDADCQLVLSVSSVCDFESSNFISGIRENMFVIDPISNASKLLLYKGRQSALWNVERSNTKDAIQPYLATLSDRYNIGMFSLEHLPNIELTSNNELYIEGTHELEKGWITLFRNKSSLGFTLVQSTFRTQDVGTVIEVSFKKQISRAGSEKSCLSNSIPNALVLGLYGYPILMSSFLNLQNLTAQDSELYIRWLQISAFFPMMKISSSFLQLGDIAINYTSDMINLHNSLMRNLIATGKMKDISASVPLLRPLWWLSPTDSVTHTIDDEFLVADKYLVAPVFCSEVRSRNIYLPMGDFKWLYRKNDGSIEKFLDGGWQMNFPVPLYGIAYFEKVNEVSLADEL